MSKCSNEKCKTLLSQNIYNKYDITNDKDLIYNIDFEEILKNFTFSFQVNDKIICNFCFHKEFCPDTSTKKYLVIPHNDILLWILYKSKQTCSKCKSRKLTSFIYHDVVYSNDFIEPVYKPDDESCDDLYIPFGDSMVQRIENGKSVFICSQCIKKIFTETVPKPDICGSLNIKWSSDLKNRLASIGYKTYKLYVDCQNCDNVISCYVNKKNGYSRKLEKKDNRYILPKNERCYNCPSADV